MSSYAWIIDKDHLFDNEEHPSITPSSSGQMGPRDAPDELLDILRSSKGNGRHFRMYDDDGELYFSGRIVFKDPRGEIVSDDLAGLPEEAFGPLWDFGTPDSGCTEIRYQVALQHVWKTL